MSFEELMESGEAFAALRAWLNQPTLDAEEREDLLTLLRRASSQDLARFREQWVPYLAAFSHHWRTPWHTTNVEVAELLSPWTPVTLEVSDQGDSWIKSLVSSDAYIHTLRAHRCQLTDPSLHALADWPGLRHVHRLDLHGNEIVDPTSLIISQHAREGAILDLGNNRITALSPSTLDASTRWGHVCLWFNPMDPSEQRALEATAHTRASARLMWRGYVPDLPVFARTGSVWFHLREVEGVIGHVHRPEYPYRRYASRPLHTLAPPIGWTPLHAAAATGDMELLHDALDLVDIDMRVHDLGDTEIYAQQLRVEETALHVALRRGHHDVAGRLMDLGASIHVPDMENVTAQELLHRASRVLTRWLHDSGRLTEELLIGMCERHNTNALLELVHTDLDFESACGPGGVSLRAWLETPGTRGWDVQRQRILALLEARAQPHCLVESRSSKTRCVACRGRIRRGSNQFGWGTLGAERVSYDWYHEACAREQFPDLVEALQERQP